MLRGVAARDWHLVQLNIALARAPLHSPQLASFVELLEPINALADAATGVRVAAADRDRGCHRDPRVR